MTLFVFPNPRPAVKAILTAAKPSRWPTATIDTKFPTTVITVPLIQHAFDGAPSQQQVRQNATMRLTCWAPERTSGSTKTRSIDEAIDLAQLVAATLLDGGSATVWRFRNAVGFNNGVDPDNGLPFCTFTITAEMRPLAVA